MRDLPNIPELKQPELLDIVLNDINLQLMDGLEWLNIAVGNCDHLKESINNKIESFPALFIGKNNYLKLFPDDKFGNFGFFNFQDTETIEDIKKSFRVEKSGRWILWFNYETVYSTDYDNRSLENIKKRVLKAFSDVSGVDYQIRVKGLFVRHDNIYNGFSSKEIDTQHLMRPYGGLRLDFDLKYNSLIKCSQAGIPRMIIEDTFIVT